VDIYGTTQERTNLSNDDENCVPDAKRPRELLCTKLANAIAVDERPIVAVQVDYFQPISIHPNGRVVARHSRVERQADSSFRLAPDDDGI
jgi:hypothetical protein